MISFKGCIILNFFASRQKLSAGSSATDRSLTLPLDRNMDRYPHSTPTIKSSAEATRRGCLTARTWTIQKAIANPEREQELFAYDQPRRVGCIPMLDRWICIWLICKKTHETFAKNRSSTNWVQKMFSIGANKHKPHYFFS